MMPVMDGMEALKKLREISFDIKPVVIMATALADKKTKQKAKMFGANGYVTKPVSSQMVDAMLNRYIDKSALADEPDELDTFDEFDDFDDFNDFSSFDNEEANIQKDMMTKFNQSHQKVSAKTFLEDYPNLEYILEDIEDLDYDVDMLIESLDEHNLQEDMEQISSFLAQYAIFLNTFIDFYELSSSLNMLRDVLENADYSAMDEKQRVYVATFIKAILQDLKNWKDHVFVEQNAVDVFYINASSLNSCIQLESYIKNSNAIKENSEQ